MPLPDDDMRYRYLPPVVSCVSMLMLGCTPSHQATAPSQVVARVNETDLTVHQLNHMLASRRVASSTDSVLRLQALEALIDQQVLAHQARRDGADRDPAVLAAIQSATNRILAQAQADRLTSRTDPPSSTDVDAFYDAHPELFKERRVYTVDELSIPMGMLRNPDELRARASKARRVDDINGWLQSNGVAAARQTGVIRPEDLSLDNASRLQTAQTSDILVMNPGSGGTQVLQVLKFERHPVSRTQAKPWIERKLLDTRQRERLNTELAALRGASKIELMGEFAQSRLSAVATDPTPRSGSAVDRGVGALK